MINHRRLRSTRLAHRFLAGPGLLILLLASCTKTSSIEEPQSVQSAPVSWAQQLARVRSGDSTEIHDPSGTITSAQWAQLGVGCERVTVVDVQGFADARPDLSVLTHLPELRQLRLGANADDTTLAELATLRSLRVLNLPEGTFSDAGLSHLQELPELELLRFHSPRVTDAGLQSIAGLPRLRFLHLIGVPITDAGLKHMHGMSKLESFYLDGSNCSDAALSELLQAIPGLHFHRDQLHLPGDRHSHPH